jgi:glucose/mannose-6-phosphate isomerase
MMNELIADFPNQLVDALAIGEKIALTADYAGIENIVVVGMGGSGIGANYVAAIVAAELRLPFLVHKGYVLPAFVGKKSLVIASSYSGNTEETLMSISAAQAKGAKIICIASGGALIDLAKSQSFDYVLLPNHGAPPRACLGYSLVQQLFILKNLGLISMDVTAEIKASIALLQQEQESIQLKATRIAPLLMDKMPVLYACENMEPAAVRLRQQLNENAKILALHHVVPEMNHNELVGWRAQAPDFAVIFFRSDFDFARNVVRTNINKEIISHFSNTIIEINCKGDSFMQQLLYATHIGDWISWQLATLRNIDSMEVKVIDFLKSQLAEYQE